MDQQKAYADEFDEIVSKYNEWLLSSENPKVKKKKHRQNKWRAFLDGVGSVLDIFGRSSISRSGLSKIGYDHPLYSRKDLNHVQKDAIALASDWQRIDKNLDNIISGDSLSDDISVEYAIKGKLLVQEMYEHFRNIYVVNKIR